MKLVNSKRYNSFNDYLRYKHGTRVQRLSLDAGFTCPNRDGTLSFEGCIFCNQEGFAKYANTGISLSEQIEQSMTFAKERYKAGKFIAYFQNASGTYASCNQLKEKYEIIRNYPDIVGLYISTRPDCIDNEKLEMIKTYASDYEVWIEYGVQSIHNTTLDMVNRGHTFEDSVKAIKDTAQKGIKVGAHLIFGLPGESMEDMINTVKKVSTLPVSGIKFHMLHILKNTALAELYREKEIKLMDMDEYINIISDSIRYLDKDCVILRLVSDANREVLIALDWMKEKQKVICGIENRLDSLNIFQGEGFEQI
jgi:uncharacterized protein